MGDKFKFYHVNSKECANKHGVTAYPGLALFRNFEEKVLPYSGSFETAPIVDFLLTGSVPTLIEFSEDYIEPIFGARNAAIFLFRDNEDNEKPFAKVFE